ncbi:P44/Msp2 family outer membrane protein, partial [Anaplasma marginale]
EALKGQEEIGRLRELAAKVGELEEKLGRLEVKELREELAAIRELEEQLKTLAEIKEVKGLAEKQKAGGLEIQEGLQLTEKIKALNVGIVGGLGRLEAKRLGEADGRLVEKLERLGRLDELVPGKTLGEMKATLKRLRELAEKDKLEKFKGKDTADLVTKGVGWLVGFVESAVIGQEKLGDVLKGEELVNLEKKLAKIKALEELTEIAEKRGVATVMKAALTNAMEIAKNRGWTDYLNSLDVSERANAAKELIAAEKIRKWARDINNLDADERAMVAGALTLFLTPSTTV